MDIKNAVVLITGANRGLGLEFARQSIARGARKVYAGARDPNSVTLPGVEALKLDVTRAEDVAAAARRCGDVTILINNAGIAVAGSRLPSAHYAVGSAVNQATRQIGSVTGVAVTMLLIGHAGLTRADFVPLYMIHIGLALLTAALCLAVNSKLVRAGT